MTPPDPPMKAVLFDRDGTLVVDVPYNGEPERVELMPGVVEALGLLRAAGLRTGVVSNQSGVGRGLITSAQVAAVNGRIEALAGPFDTWQTCPHTAEDGCACRKPAPGLVRQAADALGVRCDEVVVIGDIGSDMDAASAAGARGVLVPTPVTRPAEIADAPAVASDLLEAVGFLLAEAPHPEAVTVRTGAGT